MEKNSNISQTICEVYFVETKNVSGVSQNGKTKSLTISVGDWEKIYFSPGTAKFNELFKDSDAGGYYNQSLELSFPGIDNETQLENFNMFNRKRMLIKIIYGNGTTKLIGDLEHPCLAEKSYKDSDYASKIIFMCNYPELAYILI